MASEKKFKSFVEGGHVFELDSDGDIISIEGPYVHDYILCVICKEAECWACNQDFQNTICTKRDEQPTIPGLEYFPEGETNAN